MRFRFSEPWGSTEHLLDLPNPTNPAAAVANTRRPDMPRFPASGMSARRAPRLALKDYEIVDPAPSSKTRAWSSCSCISRSAPRSGSAPTTCQNQAAGERESQSLWAM